MSKRSKVGVVSRTDIFVGHSSLVLTFWKIILENELTQVGQSGLFTDRNSFFEIDFETIVFWWIMRSGDSNCEVNLEATCGKVHHRRSNDAKINDITSLVGNATSKFIKESGRGSADIATDCDFFGAEMHHYRSAEFISEIVIKFFPVNTADIVSFENFRIKHRINLMVSVYQG